MSRIELFNAILTFIMCGIILVMVKIITIVVAEPETAVYITLALAILKSYSVALRK